METQEIQGRLEVSLKESMRFYEIIKEHEIEDEQEYGEASDLLKATKGKIKLLDQERTLTVKPLNDQVREINSWYKKPLDKLKTIESALKKMLAQYQLKQREEQARLLEEAASEKTDHAKAQVLVMQAAKKATPAVSGVSVREVWKWDLVDESQIPQKYYSVDPAKIEAAVKAGEREIPGVRIYKEARVAVRS
jgi:ABC-type proline/glycine betaine transport system ATPase subunit